MAEQSVRADDGGDSLYRCAVHANAATRHEEESMQWTCNDFGVPQYPDGDVRRLMVLLAAIDLLERPTQAAVSDLSGYPREQIDVGVMRLREECGVNLHRVGEIYHIADWGTLLMPEGVRRHLKPL